MLVDDAPAQSGDRLQFDALANLGECEFRDIDDNGTVARRDDFDLIDARAARGCRASVAKRASLRRAIDRLGLCGTRFRSGALANTQAKSCHRCSAIAVYDCEYASRHGR